VAFNREQMLKFLRDAAERGASEVHFKVPNRPMIRDHETGALVATTLPALTARDSQAVVYALGGLAQVEIPVNQLTDTEFSFGLPGVGRFRAYVFRQRGSVCAIVKRVETNVPTMADFSAPPEADEAIGRPGLTLVAGARNEELLAACVDAFNRRSRGHVWLIESPLSYLHRDGTAAISQREVPTDVPDFPAGIHKAMRIGVDLLVVREVADRPTADALLTAAERGLAVVASIAAPDAEDASWWVSRLFEGEHRRDAERRIAAQLRTILLLPATGAAQVHDTRSAMRVVAS